MSQCWISRCTVGVAGVLLSVIACAAELDATASEIGFTLKTRWGQTLLGRFPHYTGQIVALPDDHYQVRLRLSAKEVEIVDNPNYTKFTRGPGFFDVTRYNDILFVSDMYPVALMRTGGALAGELTIRGRQQREVFTVRPAECGIPAVGCDVVATGSIRRSDYGIDRWSFALSDRVRFTLRVRIIGELGS